MGDLPRAKPPKAKPPPETGLDALES